MNFYGSSWNIFFATFVQIRLQKVVGKVQKEYYFLLSVFPTIVKMGTLFWNDLIGSGVKSFMRSIWQSHRIYMTIFEDSRTLIFFLSLGGYDNFWVALTITMLTRQFSVMFVLHFCMIFTLLDCFRLVWQIEHYLLCLKLDKSDENWAHVCVCTYFFACLRMINLKQIKTMIVNRVGIELSWLLY